jgi:hypothetical protein
VLMCRWRCTSTIAAMSTLSKASLMLGEHR